MLDKNDDFGDNFYKSEDNKYNLTEMHKLIEFSG